jgi:hypothetical protein
MKNTDQSDFEKWLGHRLQSQPEPEVTSEFLAAQRRSIYRRMDEPRRDGVPMRWAISLAMLLLVFAGGITLERRHRVVSSSTVSMSDDQLFSDLSAMEQSSEPKAIQPIHGLFQE